MEPVDQRCVCVKRAMSIDTAEDAFNRGNAFFASESYPQALLAFSQAIELDEDDAKLFRHRGLLKKKMKDFPGVCVRGLSVAVYCLSVRCVLAYLLLLCVCVEIFCTIVCIGAVADFESAIQKDPKEAMAFYHCG